MRFSVPSMASQYLRDVAVFGTLLGKIGTQGKVPVVATAQQLSMCTSCWKLKPSLTSDLDFQKEFFCFDFGAGLHVHLGDGAVYLGMNAGLHLHRFHRQ